jgi:clan AA aspartic protease
MRSWTGYFAKSGSPALKIKVSGPFNPAIEYEAVLDTGFTGFLSIPLTEAIRLGLVLYGTTSVSFANGETSWRLTANGKIDVGGEWKIGVAILEWQSTELLLGMAFLRQFGEALFVSKNAVSLFDEAELQKLTAATNPKPTPPKTAPQI